MIVDGSFGHSRDEGQLLPISTRCPLLLVAGRCGCVSTPVDLDNSQRTFLFCVVCVVLEK